MREPGYTGGGAWFQYPLMSAVWNARCTGAEKSVLVCMAWHAKPGGGEIFPSIRRLAKLTGYSRSTTETAVASLIGRGYVSIVRKGSQTASNGYKINVATLLENETGGVPAIGTADASWVSLPQGQEAPGVSLPVSLRVSLPALKPVPATGTEQTTTLRTSLTGTQEPNSPEVENGLALWFAAVEILRSRVPKQSFDTWLRPIRAGVLAGTELTLNLPSGDFAHVTESQTLNVLDALRTAAQSLGFNLEGVTTVWPESSLESTNFDPRQHPPTLSPRSAPKWQRNG